MSSRLTSNLVCLAVALLGAAAFAAIALNRGESMDAAWLVTGCFLRPAVCTTENRQQVIEPARLFPR
jgi:hypothetical protein